MAAVTLENKALQVFVDPARGACIMALFIKRDGSLIPLMPDARIKNTGLDSACFLMIPYSNRIEDGIFTFSGTKYQLADGKNHALHGDVRFREWDIEDMSDTHISCKFSSDTYNDINWPWPFDAHVEYTLDDEIFSSRLKLENHADSDMPAGFGWHPYFNRELTRKVEPVDLCMKVEGAYPDDNDNRIPSGPPGPLSPEQDFTNGKRLMPDSFLDTCYQGYDGNGYIAWPESGVKINYKCSPLCSHLVMYNPVSKPYFAVEPVTNANNGVNLYAKGRPDSGIRVLSPRNSMEASFSMHIDIR